MENDTVVFQTFKNVYEEHTSYKYVMYNNQGPSNTNSYFSEENNYINPVNSKTNIGQKVFSFSKGVLVYSPQYNKLV